MRSIVIIISVLLSFIFGGGRASDACDRNRHCTDAVIECADKDATDKTVDINNVALLPVRTTVFSGDGTSFAPSVRSTHSGRRVQPSSKAGFRVIKTGKVFDRNIYLTFRADILRFQSGIHSNSRYIHSICQLLI